jgi:predicted acylesterase/phospholipase RssA
LFDTARERLTIDHLMASCGMLPEFAPVTIDGRLLGDGGLAANAPFEPILADAGPRLVFVLDLFARDGGRPRSFAAALARKNELMFCNQTLRTLEFWRDTSRGRNGGKRVFISATAHLRTKPMPRSYSIFRREPWTIAGRRERRIWKRPCCSSVRPTPVRCKSCA